MKPARAVAAGALALPLFLILVVTSLGAGAPGPQRQAVFGIDTGKIPPLARQALPIITGALIGGCSDLSAVWIVAQAQAESGWHPRAWADDRNGGTAGLLQINQANWIDLGGQPWRVPAHSRPPRSHRIWSSEEHLTRGIKLSCRNLRTARTILARTNPLGLSPIEGMLVCHNAGCGTLAGGQIGPGVRRYLDRITRYALQYAATSSTPDPGRRPPPTLPDTCATDRAIPRPNPRTCRRALQWATDATQRRCEWYRRCLAFTAHAYGWAASGEYSAWTHWNAMLRHGTAHPGDTEPPPGALVFWRGGKWGHVALYLGNGRIASNDIVRHGCIDIVRLSTPERRWRYSYLGWAPPYFPRAVGQDRNSDSNP